MQIAIGIAATIAIGIAYVKNFQNPCEKLVIENLKNQLIEKFPNLCKTGRRKLGVFAKIYSSKKCIEKE